MAVGWALFSWLPCNVWTPSWVQSQSSYGPVGRGTGRVDFICHRVGSSGRVGASVLVGATVLAPSDELAYAHTPIRHLVLAYPSPPLGVRAENARLVDIVGAYIDS
jgi:hypothetical protein